MEKRLAITAPQRWWKKLSSNKLTTVATKAVPSRSRRIVSIHGILVALLGIIILNCGRDEPTPCYSTCVNPAEERCNVDIIQTCAQVRHRCFRWFDRIDCSDYGRTCGYQGGIAVCVSFCTDNCEAIGNTRCYEDIIQTCKPGGDGCLDWVNDVDCSDYGEACDDAGGYARCVVTCIDECESESDTRCDGNTIQTCAKGIDLCLHWTDTEVCPQGLVCDYSSGIARCITTCTNECETEYTTRCDNTIILTCTRNADGCLYWESGTDCSETDRFCDDSSGSAECVCVNECSHEFATRCYGNVVQTCTEQANGCLYWEDSMNCSDYSQFCDDSSGIAQCVGCVPNCTGRECGPDPVCGESCGTCGGVTEVCREDTGLCDDVCDGRECGTVEGISCGTCEGATEVCREETGICEDVCLGINCGMVEGISCGTCPEGDECLNGQCYTPVCDGEMCPVPAGTFWMGCNEEVDYFCDEDEYPYHEVYLDAFEVDMFEVTQAEYFTCFLDGVCQLPGHTFDPELHGEFPVVAVSWEDARTYCEWTGKRLCTEAEWEKAARGTDGRRYPWGNEPASCEFAVMDDGGDGCGTGGFMPVGSKPAGASPYGAHDMAGNVSEWVNDWYSSSYYESCASGCSNPQGPSSGVARVHRGCHYACWPSGLRASTRLHMNGSQGYCGFRCCR